MNKELATRKRSKKLGVNGLNTLEADIMNIVWQHKKTTVREVHETMMEEGYIPYTTVMAAMNNMAQKGLLKQNKSGKAYAYSATISREKLANSIVDTVIKRILGGVATPVILHILEQDKGKNFKSLFELRGELISKE